MVVSAEDDGVGEDMRNDERYGRVTGWADRRHHRAWRCCDCGGGACNGRCCCDCGGRLLRSRGAAACRNAGWADNAGDGHAGGR